MSRPVISALFSAGLLIASLSAQIVTSAQTPGSDFRPGTGDRPRYVSREQAAPVFDALGEPIPAAADWSSWIAARDRETRARVKEGDETSIVHWLLFGTTFTARPRITSQQIDAKTIAAAVEGRLIDFERAIAGTNGDERARFARDVLGTGPAVRSQLLSMLERVMQEGERHARLAQTARALGDSRLEFAERSRIYRERGLSSDTSLRINVAVEDALRGLPNTRLVLRAAIIGPGLDFADKQEGHDFYPPQTIQPFALVDSLRRLGLAHPDGVNVTAFDVSPRVNGHLRAAAERARSGSAYTIHLPLDSHVAWSPALLEYWASFGEHVGRAVSATVPQGLGTLKLRSVAVDPSSVLRIGIEDLNITAQHLPLSDDERFDLVVATNVFVYYDRLQQGLAMVNVARMLRPGGLLLSNNALVEVPSVGLRSIGYSTTLYSDREEDGDLVIWYQK